MKLFKIKDDALVIEFARKHRVYNQLTGLDARHASSAVISNKRQLLTTAAVRFSRGPFTTLAIVMHWEGYESESENGWGVIGIRGVKPDELPGAIQFMASLASTLYNVTAEGGAFSFTSSAKTVVKSFLPIN